MKTKSEIVDNWLVRYTGLELKSCGEYILLTNFDKYVKIFADKLKCPITGEDKNMTSATSNNITIINFCFEWIGCPIIKITGWYNIRMTSKTNVRSISLC